MWESGSYNHKFINVKRESEMKALKHNSKARNRLHNHPLLKKGGVHEKSEKSQRQKEKMKLKKLWSYLNLILCQ